MEELQDEITGLVQSAGGDWGVVVEHCNTDQRFALNEQEVFNAASIIKLPIMAAVFSAAHTNRMKLSDTVTLTSDDHAGGSGVLQYLSAGLVLTINDLLTLMIIQSDNTATNKLIDLVGEAAIQETIRALGMRQTSYYHKTGLQLAGLAGRNQTSANDASLFLKALASGTFISEHACLQMINILKKQQIANGLSYLLPPAHGAPLGSMPDWQLASKSGWIKGIQHDVGLLYIKRNTYVISALSKDSESSTSALGALAKIGQAVYRYGMKKQQE